MTILAAACKGVSHEITAGDSGTILEAAVGEKIALKLEGNPSTGYNWEVLNNGSPALKLVDEDWNYEDQAPGSPGMVTFSFEAEQTGETEIHLVYHRLWEEDVPPIDEFRLTIIVK